MCTGPSRRALLFLAVIVAACSAACSAAPPSPAPARASIAPAPPSRATVPPTAPPGHGEVPAAVLAAARADLATLAGAEAAGAAEVVRAEAVTWPDGSLGCPVPGMLYVQVETPGYWIVLRANGTEHDVRATATGQLRRCERPLQPAP